LTINTSCVAYKKRPFIKLYPLDCLVYTSDGTITDKRSDTNPMNTIRSDGERGIIDGSALKERVKTADQIDAFVAQIRRENDKLKDKIESKDAEIKKLKETIEKQAVKLRDNYNEINRLTDAHDAPLKAGALQLRELLMTEHQGSTFGEMLQFCFKDINRNYPKDSEADIYDPEDDGQNFIFPMSPRGLPYDCEHLTRQEC